MLELERPFVDQVLYPFLTALARYLSSAILLYRARPADFHNQIHMEIFTWNTTVARPTSSCS